ncbi:hypothetical protein HUU53_03840 [Candidatus Micrarchaeota archaeon]|nr:hypothetical protein [Candidatus Micrarchaeota archaeon]
MDRKKLLQWFTIGLILTFLLGMFSVVLYSSGSDVIEGPSPTPGPSFSSSVNVTDSSVTVVDLSDSFIGLCSVPDDSVVNSLKELNASSVFSLGQGVVAFNYNASNYSSVAGVFNSCGGVIYRTALVDFAREVVFTDASGNAFPISSSVLKGVPARVFFDTPVNATVSAVISISVSEGQIVDFQVIQDEFLASDYVIPPVNVS